MKAATFIAHFLQASRVSHVFELVGGMIVHILDAISTDTSITIVSCHHEQAAGFSAEGHARMTGIPGVALATSGPGATNLLTAIGSCYFDSTPAVFITGQVNTHELKGQRGIRQLGFQETDIVSMALPICKSAVQVQTASELPGALSEAFKTALEGRQGPCLVDIPMNVQADDIDEDLAQQFLSQHVTASPVSLQPSSQHHLSQRFSALQYAVDHAERPLLLMGGGCATVANRSAARWIAEKLAVPIVFSLMAVDLLAHDHPLRVGFIGSYGNRWANIALAEADVLIVIGSRLDIRQTGSDLASFCAGKEIWQIDIDSAEMGVRVQPQHTISCSIQEAAKFVSERPKLLSPKDSAWIQRINSLRGQYPLAAEYTARPDEIHPTNFLVSLSRKVTGPCCYVTDVGQHQMWAAQSLSFDGQARFLTSGGMGAMGFGLPASIGAALSNPEAVTVLMSGDGSFQLNIQELETMRRNNLNIKIIVFNNDCHGMVRQFQESYFEGRVQSTVKGYSTPDFVSICAAYAIPSIRLTAALSVEESLDWLLASPGPSFLEVPLSMASKVYPKLAFGRPFGSMEPDVTPLAMEST